MDAYKIWEFRKNCANHPWGENLWSKFEIWTVLGLYSHISAPMNVKFGTGERTFGPLPHAKFHVYQGNVSPLRGEKPYFWTTE